MKSQKDIDKEIKKQISNLKKKEVVPEILLLGSMSYYTLKVANPKLQEHTPNAGMNLKEYMGLRIVHRPVYESGGIFKAEDESVEVFGR